jgi:hypothetical protein
MDKCVMLSEHLLVKTDHLRSASVTITNFDDRGGGGIRFWRDTCMFRKRRGPSFMSCGMSAAQSCKLRSGSNPKADAPG